MSDLQLYEPDSSSSSSEEDDDDDDGYEVGSSQDDNASTRSSATSTAAGPSLESKLNSIADAEFTSEVTASLERAWTENHTVENAAVELKTLRMASNVPLRRVRQAVVRFLLEKIVGKEQSGFRERIPRVVGRWGGLIDAIGGSDAVETIEILQEVCAKEPQFLSLFGLLLGALYQEDIIEEDDVRAWHRKPESRGLGVPGMEKCWMVGSRMIEQFDAQEADDSGSESDSE